MNVGVNIYQYSISTAGMLCSLFRKWSGNCTYGNATALQSLREFTHDNGGIVGVNRQLGLG
jgi:hypothetical protein